MMKAVGMVGNAQIETQVQLSMTGMEKDLN